MSVEAWNAVFVLGGLALIYWAVGAFNQKK